jgi:hypothetical protein
MGLTPLTSCVTIRVSFVTVEVGTVNYEPMSAAQRMRRYRARKQGIKGYERLRPGPKPDHYTQIRKLVEELERRISQSSHDELIWLAKEDTIQNDDYAPDWWYVPVPVPEGLAQDPELVAYREAQDNAVQAALIKLKQEEILQGDGRPDC